MRLDTRGEMICVNTRYFNINRLLLLTVGLWPYEQSKIVRLQVICLCGVLISSIIFQLTTFLTSECTLQLIVEVLSPVIFFTTYIVKYSSYSLNTDAIRRLLDLLQYIFDELKDEGEKAIMEEYGNAGKRYTILLTVFGFCGTTVLTILPFWPSILDIVSPRNESRPHPQLQMVTEYFIDPDKYFFAILLHSNAANCIGGMTMLAIGTMNITYIQLICGLFKVASYRMEQAMTVCTVNVNSTESENLIHKGIVCAVEMHRIAMGFVTFRMTFIQVYISKMEVSFFLIIVTGVISSSLNLFREVSTGFELGRMILPIIFLYIFYVYVIIANNCAQQITDHNDHVFATVYNVEWYEAPLAIQKVILFMLQRSNKPFHVNLGGVFTGSLESAAKLMSTSMSYFTVLYSTRQEL